MSRIRSHTVWLAWLVSVATAVAQPGMPDTELLQGHLAQAAALAPSASQPGMDTALQQFQADMAARRQAWTNTLVQSMQPEELLAGIPQPTLEQAQRLALEPAAVQAVLRDGATLPLLLALVAGRNAEVQSAYQNWRAILQRFEQATYLEELVAQYRSFVRELDTQVGPQSHKEMPGRTFAFPSVLALKGQAIDLEASIARLSYQQTLRKVLNEAARTMFDVQFAAQAKAILIANRELVAQMEAIARAQLQVGEARHVDALKAQSLLAMLDNKLVTTERQQLNAIAQVHALLAVPPYTPWGAWAEVELPDQIRQMDAVLQQVQAESQEFLKAARDVELMQTMVRMAETMLYPRASTGASQVAPSLGAEAGPTRQAMAAFPPLPVVSHEAAGFGANAAYINELRIRVTQAHSLFDEATARTAFLAQDAHYRVDVSRRDVRTLAGTVVPRAQQALAATRAQYAAGRASLSDVLEASRAHVEAAFMLAEARRERNKALVDLQDATGRTVSRLLTGSTP